MVNNINNNFAAITMPSPTNSAFFMFLFLPLLFNIQVTSYKPVEDFAIRCGFSGNSNSLSNRNWTGDVDSKLFTPIEPQNGNRSVTAAPSQHSSSAEEVPYGTARLSLSEFTYSFPVSDGQKFLRLHFYPASYPNFDRYNSLFSVKAGRYTLLKDFNASLTADNDSDLGETVTKEYCINVDPGERLNVTFTPSSSYPNAYAFINGIEIVSMPTDLYYTKPDEPFELVGHEYQYQVENKSALETLYRINVGGAQISAKQDTGMFRYWDDDVRYVEEQHPHSEPSGFGLKVAYKDGQNYSAPEDVYLTARTCGKYETCKYNVTWAFKVDSDFFYMVRLHFCEFEKPIQKVGERVFQILIADILAEPHADVIEWSKGNLVPVYRDYAVQMLSKGISKKVSLSIKLRAHPDETESEYDDFILNGIEIFKISDSNDNLAGPNPDPLPSPPKPLLPLKRTSKNRKKTFIIAVVVGAGSILLVLSLIGFLIFRRRMTRAPVKDGNSRRRQIMLATPRSRKTYGPSLPSDLCRYFTIAEIRAATNNFDDIFIVGVGGFGNVYKGYIDDNTTPVAIKRLKPGSQQGAQEFLTEIEMLSQLRHLHLVSLIGYCDDGNEMILVYDFMARGSLREYLYDSDNQPLCWEQRLEICLGAAQGLHYLHTGGKHNIIHRDVKTTNILLDEKWVAKVSDFGLSKIGPTGMSKSHISTVVKGSLGYLDPEYYKRQRLTQKSDVYSFGVVLLEVLCGRPPLLRTVEKQQANLVEWVRKCQSKGEIEGTVDPVLRGSIKPECLKQFSELALSCLVDDGGLRPSMNDVVWGLEFALQLQGSKDDNRCDGRQEESALLPKLSRDEESDMQFTSTDGSVKESESSNSKVSTMNSEEQTLLSDTNFSRISTVKGLLCEKDN